MRSRYRKHIRTADLIAALERRLRHVQEALATGDVTGILSAGLPEHLWQSALADQQRLIHAELQALRAGGGAEAAP
jgi:hypothetical protein